MIDNLPAFPFGAVYFRKSNPPREDWARDYQTAADDGLNIFRHWFLWGAIETAPGVYDWDDYDRQLDLAAEHGIKTVIAEMITVAPEFAYRRYAHARYETAEGRKLGPRMHGSCVVGGAPGLCLDHADLRAAAECFLRALVTRYRDHPGLGAYDVWNECNYPSGVCYCPATVADFHAWLRERYGDLRSLGEAWHRYSFESWEDVTPPRQLGPYPDTLDWLAFRIDNAHEQMRWRVDLIRELDPDHPITAHGVGGSLRGMAMQARHDWRAAEMVDGYGLTWVACRKGDEPWKQWHGVDLTRAAARGKDFWHAETQGGPLWLQPQVIGRPREDGRIPEPEDLRLWHLTSFAAGARGLLYPRWRPLLDGPLFGAFGPYGMDGGRTDRSRMTSRLARWANDPEQAELWRSEPVKGEVGILVVPETQLFTQGLMGSTAAYARSMEGAYQGFFDANVQADWVLAVDEDMAAYDLLYLPFPVMLSQATADKLMAFVRAGGTLISEGCPGTFGDRWHVGEVQPNLGLDELFGTREAYVEFTPDLLEDLRVNVDGVQTWGGAFLQAYTPTSSTAVGWYADGRIAAVDHVFGEGRARLIGTMCGHGYDAHPDDRDPAFYRASLAWAGVTPHVTSSDPRVKARLQDGAGGTYLWAVNSAREDVPVRLTLSETWGPFAGSRAHWGPAARVAGRRVTLTVPARDAAVLRLMS